MTPLAPRNWISPVFCAEVPTLWPVGALVIVDRAAALDVDVAGGLLDVDEVLAEDDQPAGAVVVRVGAGVDGGEGLVV